MLGLRLMMLSVLLAMYVLNPVLGVAAVAAGFGYVAGQRLPRQQS